MLVFMGGGQYSEQKQERRWLLGPGHVLKAKQEQVSGSCVRPYRWARLVRG